MKIKSITSVVLVMAAGCSTTSLCKKVATIGLDLVGDAVVASEIDNESKLLVGKKAQDADQRFGPPRGVYTDLQSQREVRLYNVDGDLLGTKRWVIELAGGRIDGISQAQENPDIGKDHAEALVLKTRLQGMTAQQVESTEVLGKLIFDSEPRRFRRVPTNELVYVYDVTSFLDVTGSRFVVLDFDSGGHCRKVRFLGMPKK